MGRLISLRGDAAWRGRSTRAVSDRGGRPMRRIINGYVSSDGHEIRQFPGFHTICDLTADNNTNGFERRIVDSRRPVYDWAQSSSHYQYYAQSSVQTVVTFARPTHLHWLRSCRGVLVVGGESDFRKNPIYGSPRTEITVTGLQINTGTGRWLLETSSTPGPYGLSDSGNPGGNGLAVGDVVYVEIESTSAVLSPFVESDINRLCTIVLTIAASPNSGRAQVQLDVISAGTQTTSPHPSTGNVWRVRCNRSDLYPISPYEPDPFDLIDDPDALTIWSVKDALNLDNPCGLRAEPAWVANRQRDHGDVELASSHEGVQGKQVTSPFGSRSVSRRQQKVLPFVTVPEVAGNRVIVAAPGYHCVFQCPIVVPIAGENWPSPLEWSPRGGPGVPHWFNDLHDKPRALGVPKGWLVDSVYTPFPTPLVSPPAWTPPYNIMAYAIAGMTGLGWPAGTYRFAVTYVDEITGEEGLASEEVEVTVPSAPSGHSYGIQLHYMVPGYWFPETLALSMNIYFAASTVGPLGLYKRVPLRGGSTTPDQSAKYGISQYGSPEDSGQTLYRTIQLPVPVNTSSLSDAADTDHIAPDNLQMPRGSECFRVIRGIGLSVGSLGTHGKHRELYGSRASSIFDHRSPNFCTEEDMVRIRGTTPVLLLATPTSPVDGDFGIASKYFPPAYQGVGFFSNSLYPAPRTLSIVDRMLNSKTTNIPGEVPNREHAHRQRLRMTEDIWDQDKSHTEAGATPTVGSPFVQNRRGERIYVLEPRGQIQVSEPDRPEVMIPTAIQFIDPNSDDDGTAIGNLGGNAIICSRRETFLLPWTRFPTAGDLQQVTNEHGCISARSMVQFDGGLAWMGARGPCAMMPGFIWCGADLEHDFFGDSARYAKDSAGMMRHCWGAHDPVRGLVYWGLVTSDAEHQISFQGRTGGFAALSDEAKSRFPANEVLIWSYRANAFSTWVPPEGLEVRDMAMLTDSDGNDRMCFLAADNRIYALDDEWHDTNRTLFETSVTQPGSSSTSLTVADSFEVDDTGASTARGTGENLVREGMPVLIIDADGVIRAKTTVASAVAATKVVTLADASTWPALCTVQIGHRQDLRVVTSFIGDTADNLDVENVHVRYSLHGDGNKAFCKADWVKSDLRPDSVSGGFTQEESVWQDLGNAESEPYGSRRQLAQGRPVSPEVSVDLTFTGGAQVRVADIMLEVGS